MQMRGTNQQLCNQALVTADIAEFAAFGRRVELSQTVRRIDGAVINFLL
jgi:hypothetical protein